MGYLLFLKISCALPYLWPLLWVVKCSIMLSVPHNAKCLSFWVASWIPGQQALHYISQPSLQPRRLRDLCDRIWANGRWVEMLCATSGLSPWRQNHLALLLSLACWDVAADTLDAVMKASYWGQQHQLASLSTWMTLESGIFDFFLDFDLLLWETKYLIQATAFLSLFLQ